MSSTACWSPSAALRGDGTVAGAQGPGRQGQDRQTRRSRLARLHPAGQLVAITVPSPQQEAVRDLCRLRASIVADLTRAPNRLTKFLLRHGRVWRGGSNWTFRHERWVGSQHFEHPALAATFGHLRAGVQLGDSCLEAVEADLAPWWERAPFGEQVRRLATYRGVTAMGGLCLAAEVFDWRRFPYARRFMSFTGLVPGEHSSGAREHRGHITHAGNAHLRAQLVESAWSYQHRPAVGGGIRARQEGLSPEVVARAWAAQVRLSARFRRLATRKNVRSVVATAVARELAGFLWAEMNAA